MTTTDLKDRTLEGFERMFHQGDLDYVDEVLGRDGVDHQEAAGASFCDHLKQVVVAMRTAFPDVHFDVHEILAEGDVVACRSTMTGTHLGRLELVPPGYEPTGRQVRVSHMHFFRYEGDRVTDLWHLWDTPGLARQLGAAPQPTR
jgi:steroid delta-isomerase-like uncharacterized protein